MMTVISLLAATTLIICLLEFVAILGLRRMLEDANGEIEGWKVRGGDWDKRQLELVGEAKTLAHLLEAAKNSRLSVIGQFEQQLQTNKRLQDEQYEYREMLKNIAHIFEDNSGLMRQVMAEDKS